jgi:hypothetical protein
LILRNVVKFSRIGAVGVIGAMLACAGCSHGPVDARTMHAGAMLVTVPPHWVQVYGNASTGKARLGLSKVTTRFIGTPATVDLKESPYIEGPWTAEAAKRWQDDFVKLINSQDNGESAIPLQEGKAPYLGTCVRSSGRSGKMKLHCVIVGTPMQFDFAGGEDSFNEATGILDSLR